MNTGIFDPEGKNINPLNNLPYSDEYKNLSKMWSNLPAYKKRDEIVFQNCDRYQIPVQVSMGGGYSPEIKTIIEAHANTYRVAKDVLF
jgi:acetoin utilization deacetylase AcuC-like enzyme